MASVRRRTAGELARGRKEGSRRKEGQPEEGGAAEERGAVEEQSGGQPAEEQSGARSAGVAAGSYRRARVCVWLGGRERASG
jgi:hypothetical protein